MTRAEELARGIQLILKYEPRAECEAQHDVLYCGGNKTQESLKQQLTDLGWHYDDDCESWAFFT
jgi:uncharacterized protein YeaC (DUF1315 family)